MSDHDPAVDRWTDAIYASPLARRLELQIDRLRKEFAAELVARTFLDLENRRLRGELNAALAANDRLAQEHATCVQQIQRLRQHQPSTGPVSTT